VKSTCAGAALRRFYQWLCLAVAAVKLLEQQQAGCKVFFFCRGSVWPLPHWALPSSRRITISGKLLQLNKLDRPRTPITKAWGFHCLPSTCLILSMESNLSEGTYHPILVSPLIVNFSIVYFFHCMDVFAVSVQTIAKRVSGIRNLFRY